MRRIAVKREFRGQQVGTHLARVFLAWYQGKGTQRLSVTDYVTNLRAAEFHGRLEFEPRNLTLELSLDDVVQGTGPA